MAFLEHQAVQDKLEHLAMLQFVIPPVTFPTNPLAGAKLQSTSIPKEIAASMVKEVQQDGKAEKDGKAKEEWKAKQDRKEKGKQGKNDKGKERA